MSAPSPFVPSEEERLVREAARAFLADRAPVARVRDLPRFEGGFDPALWQEIVALGWTGMAIAESCGGAGLGARALLAAIEEMGRSLAAAPLASSALVAGLTLARFGADDAAVQTWLRALAAGEAIAALAVDERAVEEAAHERAHPDLEIATCVFDDITGTRLSGTKRYVADGIAADLLLVSARRGGATVLALVAGAGAGVARGRLASIDGRGLAEIRLDDAPVLAVLTERDGRDPVTFARDAARIALAAEMLGASQQAFEDTLDYLRTRRQFGQVIGSFQALQHRAARLFIELELARSCVLAAADALHHDSADLPMLASLAKAMMGELAREVCHEMIQLHGGIGMTEAHHAGLYLKRCRMAQLLHGDPAFHRDRYGRLMGMRGRA